MENILSTAGCAPDWEEQDVLAARCLDLSTFSVASLSAFLDMFAPLQLLVDRKKHKNVPMHRKVLGTCSALFAAHSLVKSASDIPGSLSVIDKLANGLSVNKQIAKPHPLWNSGHDAVLINAITKHGWIEQDSCCRAITEDGSIKWGAPFDVDKGSDQKSKAPVLVEANAKPDVELVRETSRITAEFLNSEHEMIGKMKGFSQEQVVKAYGLIQISDETDSSLSPSQKTWVVDDNLLLQNLNAPTPEDDGVDANVSDDAELEVDLPSKKDLLKRAKTILSRGTFLPQQPSGAPASATTKPLPNHGFYVLDQTNPCNLFLADLLRGLLRISFVKDAATKKMAKYLCSSALMEARRLSEAFKNRYAENDYRTKELENIANHISLVGRTMQTSSRPAKNVLRAVLGEPLVLPKPNSSEPVFPFVGNIGLIDGTAVNSANTTKVEVYVTAVNPAAKADTYVPASPNTDKVATSVPAANTTKVGNTDTTSTAATKPPPTAQKNASTSKRSEAAAGGRAISRAVAKGSDQNKEAKGKFSKNGDASTLELTATETLILSILCSHGLPVWSEEHVAELVSSDEGQDDPQLHVPGVDGRLSWQAVAQMIRDGAVCWSQVVAAKLQKYRAREVTESNKAKQLADIKDLEREEEAKLRALRAAEDDVANPVKFAKKCILLLEAVRLRIGPLDTNQTSISQKKRMSMMKSENFLGPYVLGWLRTEVTKWANSLQIVDYYGNTLTGTAASSDRDGEQGFTLFSIMSKQHCRAVIGQIAQLTRYRSIFISHGREEMKALVEKATKQSRRNDDIWEEMPEWWNAPTDYDLLNGLMYFGFNECPRIFSSENFCPEKEVREDRVFIVAATILQLTHLASQEFCGWPRRR